MKHFLLTLVLAATLAGCQSKVDPSWLYVEPPRQAGVDSLSFEARAVVEGKADTWIAKLDSACMDTVSHAPSYPPYFAGFYLNESGRLVIVAAGDTAEAHRDLVRLIGEDGFLVQQGRYSMHELDSIRDVITKKLPGSGIDWSNFGVNARANRIVMRFSRSPARNIRRFKRKVTDSEAVVFEATASEIRLLTGE